MGVIAVLLGIHKNASVSVLLVRKHVSIAHRRFVSDSGRKS
jgi:hypothetical protein